LARDGKAVGHKQRGMKQDVGIFTVIHWNVGQRSKWGIPNEENYEIYISSWCILWYL